MSKTLIEKVPLDEVLFVLKKAIESYLKDPKSINIVHLKHLTSAAFVKINLVEKNMTMDQLNKMLENTFSPINKLNQN